MPARHHVAIVIPVHSPKINPLEELSLRRCQKILAAYPKLLVCPEGMDASPYHGLLADLEVRAFAPAFFRSDRGYNRLLRLPDFYARFPDVEHLLIYQADCYVFTDRLRDFLDRRYDYIGAPWTNFDWLRKASPMLRFVPGLDHVLKRVGNGGLSLRRVEVFREVAERFAWLGSRMDVHEDLYWCQLVSRIGGRPVVASFDEALRFAFESEPARCLALAGGRLPFGCHAFERCGLAFWRNHLDPDELRAAGLTPAAASDQPV